jgi:hypothetical protein
VSYDDGAAGNRGPVFFWGSVVMPGFGPRRAAHRGKQPLASAACRPGLLSDDDAIALHVDLDLRPGQQPELLADLLRDGDLSLATTLMGMSGPPLQAALTAPPRQ